MRYLYLVKCPEKPVEPPRSFMHAMQRGQEEAMKDGKLIAWGGLGPTAQGVRVRLAAGEVKVTDGPFAEAKEVIGGRAVLERDSKEKAIESGVWLMELHREHWPGWEGEVGVRELHGTGDLQA